MQRILSRGEIETLDRTSMPRLTQPEERVVFQERANRLRQLSAQSPIGDYLTIMSFVADAQHTALQKYKDIPGASKEQIDRAQAHGMPPLQAAGWQRDPVWLSILSDIVQQVQQQQVPEAVQAICQELLKDIIKSTDSLERLADALLARFNEDVDPARAPFVMAALQVYWTRLGINFAEGDLPIVTPFGVCPCCGSLPVSSIVRIGGAREGVRYTTCSLCSTEWHIVRVTCTHCEDTEKIAYHSLEEGKEAAIKAESCGKCNTYRKIFYQSKDQQVEAVADDLASIELDVLMGEEGFFRVNGNPYLWQSNESEE